MKTIHELKTHFPQSGRVREILIRQERRNEPIKLSETMAIAQKGLSGDHYNSKGGKRQVTLIMQEHLETVASILGKEFIDSSLLRRNIVTNGVNLRSFKDQRFLIGDAILEYTGE